MPIAELHFYLLIVEIKIKIKQEYGNFLPLRGTFNCFIWPAFVFVLITQLSIQKSGQIIFPGAKTILSLPFSNTVNIYGPIIGNHFVSRNLPIQSRQLSGETIEIRQSTIYYVGLLGRWHKRIVDQESDVPSIISFILFIDLGHSKLFIFIFVIL